jgi:hypothetical protein
MEKENPIHALGYLIPNHSPQKVQKNMNKLMTQVIET